MSFFTAKFLEYILVTNQKPIEISFFFLFLSLGRRLVQDNELHPMDKANEYNYFHLCGNLTP